MIQYFSKSPQTSQLKELPLPKQASKIVQISYPNNLIVKIPSSICKAYNLQQIDLCHNKIASIQPLFQLKKLRVVNISHNAIVNVGKSICKMKKIQFLDLSFNAIAAYNNVVNLVDLFKIRKGKVEILLTGNKIIDDYGAIMEEKKKEIVDMQTKIQAKIDSKQQLKELQISKSLSVKKRVNTQNFQMESHQKSFITQGNHLILNSLTQSRKQLQDLLVGLIEYERKFQVISASQFKGWNEGLMGIFKKESESVRSFIEIYKQIIKILTTQFTNPTDITCKMQTYFIQASEIQQLIKDQHFNLLENLSESHEVPMVSYKIWVQFYRQCRAISQKIRWEACSIIQCQIRNQEIQALKLISPSKNGNPMPEKDQLQGLLFSKNKQKEVQELVECNQCFIKSEEVRQLRQIVEALTSQNLELKQQNQHMTKQNQRISKEDAILGKDLRARQEQIIQTLQNKFSASVYQKLIFQQAKSIENLIKCERHIMLKQKQMLDNTQKIGGDFCQTATAIAKDKAFRNQKADQKFAVSEFNFQQQYYSNSNAASKRPYFNKNEQNLLENNRRSKRNTQNSTQKKKKSVNENELKYHKQNSRGANSSISKTNILSRKVTQRQVSQTSSCKIMNKNMNQDKDKDKQKQNDKEKGQKYQENGKIIISDFAVTQTGKQHKDKEGIQPGISRKALAQLIVKKTFENKNTQNIKRNKDSKKQNNIRNLVDKEQNNLSRRQVIQQQNQSYVPTQYVSIKLKNEKSYQDYMRYHLRNNIIETLEKKGKRLSLSKQKLNKQNTIKFFSRQNQKHLIKGKKSNSCQKINMRPLSERQFKFQTGRMSSRIHQPSKSYVNMIGKFRN